MIQFRDSGVGFPGFPSKATSQEAPGSTIAPHPLISAPLKNVFSAASPPTEIAGTISEPPLAGPQGEAHDGPSNALGARHALSSRIRKGAVMTSPRAARDYLTMWLARAITRCSRFCFSQGRIDSPAAATA